MVFVRFLLLFFMIISLSLVVYDMFVLNYYSAKKAYKYANDLVNTKCLQIVVLVAVYKSGRKIYDFLNCFRMMSNNENVTLVVVSSVREQQLYKTNKESSFFWIEKYLREFPESIMHIVCPSLQGNKTHQLNYALKKLKNRFDWEDTYFAIYDVDSRPDKHTFTDVYNIFAENQVNSRIKVLQQPSVYFSNFNVSNIFMKMEALMMTRRVLGIEIPNYKRSLQCKSRYTYCVGHGMFISGKYLKDEYNGQLITPHEDVAFGIQQAMRHVKIYPMNTFDNAEVAPSVSQLRRQAGKWFVNCFQVFKVIIDEYKEKRCTAKTLVKFLVYALIDTFSWMHYFCLILCIILLYFVFSLNFLWMFFFLWLDSGIGAGIILRKFKDEIKCTLREKVIIVLISPFRELMRFSGVLQFVFYFVKSVVYKKDIIDVIPVTNEQVCSLGKSQKNRRELHYTDASNKEE